MIFDTNKDKLNEINSSETSIIKKIRLCKYIPLYMSRPYSGQNSIVEHYQLKDNINEESKNSQKRSK